MWVASEAHKHYKWTCFGLAWCCYGCFFFLCSVCGFRLIRIVLSAPRGWLFKFSWGKIAAHHTLFGVCQVEWEHPKKGEVKKKKTCANWQSVLENTIKQKEAPIKHVWWGLWNFLKSPWRDKKQILFHNTVQMTRSGSAVSFPWKTNFYPESNQHCIQKPDTMCSAIVQ